MRKMSRLGLRRASPSGGTAASRIHGHTVFSGRQEPVHPMRPAFLPPTPQESTFDSKNSPRLHGLED
jgi:hypothetical protein